MAEYVGNEARAVKPGEPIKLTSYCRSAFAIGAGLIFNADGEYLVSVHGNHMVVRDYPRTAVHDHGRLIDADALDEIIQEEISKDYNKEHRPKVTWSRAFELFEDMVLDTPTIIPAEEAKDTNVPTYDLLYEEGGYSSNGI